MKNLIDILDLSTAEIDEMIAVANNIIEHPELYREACKYKTLATLFFEPSTAHAPVFPLKLQCLNSAEEFSVSPKQAQVPLQKVKASVTPLRL